jgi:HNH endonuclease
MRFVVWSGPLPLVGTDSLAEVEAFVRAGHSIAVYVEPSALQALAWFIAEENRTAEQRLIRRQWKVARLAIDPTCGFCGRPVTLESATVDHLRPLAEGGADDESNWEIACQRCNSDKGRKSLNEHFERVANARVFRRWLAERSESGFVAA